MGRARKSYSREFRLEAVRLARISLATKREDTPFP